MQHKEKQPKEKQKKLLKSRYEKSIESLISIFKNSSLQKKEEQSKDLQIFL